MATVKTACSNTRGALHVGGHGRCASERTQRSSYGIGHQCAIQPMDAAVLVNHTRTS